MDGMFQAQSGANDSTAPCSDVPHSVNLSCSQRNGGNTTPKRIETSTSPQFQSGSCFHGSVTCWAEVGSLSETGPKVFTASHSDWNELLQKTNVPVFLPADVLKGESCSDWKQRRTSHCNTALQTDWKKKKNQSNTKSVKQFLTQCKEIKSHLRQENLQKVIDFTVQVGSWAQFWFLQSIVHFTLKE